MRMQSINSARTIAATTLAATVLLCACSSGSSTSNRPPPQPTGAAIFSRIVGVGDSLTAGYQSGGLLGINTTSPVSGFPGNLVPATQENGFWSLLVQQANGLSPASMYNPTTSPLPLIAAPGLNSQLVLGTTSLFAATHSACDAFNDGAYAISTYGTTRLNPAGPIRDVGIPGQTAHEAIYMTNPLTGPGQQPNCQYPFNPHDPTTLLQPLLDGESSTFYPILGSFAGTVHPLTQLNVALSLHPSLTTVWLGANDLLKYAFSGGRSPSDSPKQMQADIVTIITRLHAAGSRVVVANLPDVLSTPQFFQGGPTLIATLEAPPFSVPAPAAQAVTAYIQATYGVGPNGYLTESGFFVVLQDLALGNVTPTLTAPGDFLTDAFAAQVQGLNTAYNGAIGAAATATKTPLVDIHGLFATIKQDGGVPINPPKCCSLQFGGGLLSFDGLHPSNTGYALVANAFIATIDTGFATTVSPLSNAQIFAIYSTDPYAQH
ncbi:MAG TPA: SGNH/GDSL hydrolase family protein [Candidatus Eremiobacteraceae bacterium]|nr:SGNH/GDSL hydrolase family protein [Candidatus Eremiobacteraceae bacterium]